MQNGMREWRSACRNDSRIPFYILHFAFCIVLFVGCGHVNKLAHYPIQGARFFFKTSVSSDAGVVQSSVIATDTAGGVVPMSERGERIINEQLQSELARVPLSHLAAAAGRGVHECLVGYAQAVEIPTPQERSSFLAETILKNFELRSSGSGSEVHVTVFTRITDRTSATVIWDDHRTCVARISPASFPQSTEFTGVSALVASATRLTSITDEERLRILEHAADEAGRAVSDALQQDFLYKVRSEK